MNPFEEHLARYREQGYEYLRKHVAEIKRIEGFREFRDLRLVEERADELALQLKYECRAPTLFPYVRKNLLMRDVVPEYAMSGTRRENKWTSEEVYEVRMSFYSNRLQVSIRVKK